MPRCRPFRFGSFRRIRSERRRTCLSTAEQLCQLATTHATRFETPFLQSTSRQVSNTASRNQLGFQQRATDPPLVSYCSSAQTMTQNEAAPVVVTMGSTASTDEDMKPIMVVRTVTAFLTLRPEHFDVSWGSLFSQEDLDAKVAKCVNLLREVESQLQANGYTVQTIRIATNPFVGESRDPLNLHTHVSFYDIARPAPPPD